MSWNDWKTKPELLPAYPGPRVLVERAQLLAVEVDRPRRRPVESGEETEQRRLSAAGGAHDRREAARLDGERDIVQDGELTAAGAIGLGQRCASEHGRMISGYGWRGLLVALTLVACEGEDRSTSRAAPPPPPAGERARIVFLGTSLTAGLGLDPDQAYPALIQQKLDSAGLAYEAVNAGVSGETSAGATAPDRVAPAAADVGAGDRDGRERRASRARRRIRSGPISRRSWTRSAGRHPSPLVVLVGMRAPPESRPGLLPADSPESIPTWRSRTNCRWCRFFSTEWRGTCRSTRRT